MYLIFQYLWIDNIIGSSSFRVKFKNKFLE